MARATLKFYKLTDEHMVKHNSKAISCLLSQYLSIKYDKNGNIISYKARLVVRGDLQRYYT